VLDVICTWFDHFNLLDVEGLTIHTSSLVGSNLPIIFNCKEDFEGRIVFLAITFSCKIHAIWDSRVMALVGSNLPKRFYCKGGFEAIIVFWGFSFSCGVGAICDLGVGNL
jgi:hypothetical protein